jgi:hypothetical protein
MGKRKGPVSGIRPFVHCSKRTGAPNTGPRPGSSTLPPLPGIPGTAERAHTHLSVCLHSTSRRLQLLPLIQGIGYPILRLRHPPPDSLGEPLIENSQFARHDKADRPSPIGEGVVGGKKHTSQSMCDFSYRLLRIEAHTWCWVGQTPLAA